MKKGMENNGKYVKDVIERYFYQVVRRLPPGQREDIKKELQGLIEDMLSERTDNPTKEDIDAVLMELGRPWELANKYRDSKRYLIGPQYYEFYIFILKIVLGATAFGMIIAMTVSLVTSPPTDIVSGIADFLGSIIMALLQAFAWLTFGFAMAERYSDKKINFKFPDDKWKPSDLPPVPVEKATIRRSEPIAGIIFTLIVMIIFNVAPQILSVYVAGEELTVVPIFNLEIWPSIISVFNTLFVLGIAKEFVRLLFGRYNMTLAISVTLINIVSLVMAVLLFTNPAIWNPDFVSTLTSIHAFGMSSDFDLAFFVNIFKTVFVWLLVLGFIVDTVKVFYHAVRYSVTYREF